MNRLFGQIVSRDVGDVVAVVGGRILATGPFRVTGLEAFGAQLGTGGEGANLDAGVVVIKLPIDLPALALVQIADRIAQGRLTRVTDMQRAGRVGRDKFHQ